MPKNWAIAIGINQYDFLQPLNYAQRDAQLMQQFLSNNAGFENVLFFSDDSPDISGKSTRPYRANLLRILRQMFDKPFMTAGDNFWFFFSGHGIRHAGSDYLMPGDGDPGDVENTAIPISYVSERLRRCGADNVVLILDACRNQGNRSGEGIGDETATQAQQTGIITIFSCSPNELSYEVETLQQGTFTHALLEGLGNQGKCATVERLNQYLSYRVPELNRQHGKPQQTPYTIAEPVTKSHLILLPQYATLHDIATLKNDAYQAEVNNNIELSEQLWIRVLAVASGQDLEAVKSLQRIERLRIESSNLSRPLRFNNQNQDQVLGVKSTDYGTPNRPKRSITKSLFILYQSIGFVLGVGTILFFVEKFVKFNSIIHTFPTPLTTQTPVVKETQNEIQVSPTPSKQRKESVPIIEFYCGIHNNIPATMVKTPSGGERVFIYWVSKISAEYTPKQRCQEATRRLNISFKGGGGQYITYGVMNGKPVICTTDTPGNSCINILFTLNRGQDAKEILEELFQLNNKNLSSRPLRI